MRSMDNIGVTFVNTVLSRGVYNGNVNLTLGTALFTPEVKKDDTIVIVNDIVVAARLRMDLSCTQQLYMTLKALLEQLGALPSEAVDDLTPAAEASELN